MPDVSAGTPCGGFSPGRCRWRRKAASCWPTCGRSSPGCIACCARRCQWQARGAWTWRSCPRSLNDRSPSPCRTTPGSAWWTSRCTCRWSCWAWTPVCRCSAASCWSTRWEGEEARCTVWDACVFLFFDRQCCFGWLLQGLEERGGKNMCSS